ncbi:MULTISPECIES: ATP-binding cassette domain-containing protein [Fusobacterium]|jgi:ABC transporter|uniref:ABC transporter ATP-binding protein n=3 Tax=Fusobacterium TaxID=848 RepID=A0AAD0HUT1_9FUSO|nr:MULTISPECIES: ATP-binding cassette domain-containing protein [Fusobacterium]ATV34711.1 ABC transporter ATP-binding protein [Fusobacterium pseudoperiodonticum]ATV62396.1 ABC transporter ATP-binding protein [Fusobacterium pseudoperiodonticum]AVQ25389.1 ABC transporter ATP-binding protein [Fusobacterium periodonticum]KGE63835.1 peptide/nickel transport system ATP-binding protein [Fusobacterium periodonticum 2_1_31]
MSLLEIKNLKVHYPIRGGFFNKVVDHVYAVDGVSMVIEQGKTYGLIGESGSGKSTIGKTIIGLEKATAGEILYNGKNILDPKVRKEMKFNREVQMIFQDSMSSLNPKKRVLDILAEPIRNFEKLSKEAEKEKIYELLEIVGMPKDSIYKYPHEFSGGQRQRLGIARAIACKPKLIIADEPVSALDLSVQAQVLNYLKNIQRELNLSYIFISHDLGVVRHMCDYIYIMHRGKFTETGTREDIYKDARHIYTKRLIASIPQINPEAREELKKKREDVEKEYEKLYSQFYDKNGKVFDLEKISETHSVASSTKI